MVDKAEGVEGDAVLGEEGEEGIRRVVEERSGEEAAGGRDKRRGGALGAFSCDESALEDAGGGAESSGGVGVDVDVVQVVLAVEEALPERGEGDVGVGEEEEGDFGGWGGRRRGGGGERRPPEEGEVVELVGEGDGDVARRKDSRGEEEEKRQREEECEGEDERGREHGIADKHNLGVLLLIKKGREFRRSD